MAIVIPVMEHWLEWAIAQWVHHERSIRQPIVPWANAPTKKITKEEICYHYFMCYTFKKAAGDLFNIPSHWQDSIYHSVFVKHWLEQEQAQWIHHELSILWCSTRKVDGLTLNHMLLCKKEPLLIYCLWKQTLLFWHFNFKWKHSEGNWVKYSISWHQCIVSPINKQEELVII